MTEDKVADILSNEDRAGGVSRAIRDAFSQLRPHSNEEICDWSQKHIYIADGSAQPGLINLDFTPYFRGILETLHPKHPAREVIFAKGVQIGGSTIGYAAMGFWAGECGGNILLALPTEAMIRSVSKNRIDPLISNSPELKEIFANPERRTGGYTIKEKMFLGGSLALVSSESPSAMRLRSARFVIADEVDAYGDNKREGNPVELLRGRMTTFEGDNKYFITSSPTIEDGSRIWELFEKTDMRHYYIPCPECGHKHPLEWENIRYDPNDTKSAKMECPKCHQHFDESNKTEMLMGGEWRATEKTDDDSVVGFHLSGLYAPLGFVSWAKIAAEYEDAKTDDTAMKAWQNMRLGLPYKEHSFSATIDRTISQRTNYGVEGVHLPNEVNILTAAADVQKDRVEMYVYGWAKNDMPYAVDYLSIVGDPTHHEFWNRVYDKMAAMKYKRADGHNFFVSSTAIDTGGLITTDVYAWIAAAKKKGGIRRLIGVKGFKDSNRGVISVSNMHSKGRKPREIPLYHVGTSQAKVFWYRRIAAHELILPKRWANGDVVETEYDKQMTSERGVKDTKYGGFKWKKKGGKNEALDCAVYAYAALKNLNLDWDKVEANVGHLAVKAKEDDAKAAEITDDEAWIPTEEEEKGMREDTKKARDRDKPAPAKPKFVRRKPGGSGGYCGY